MYKYEEIFNFVVEGIRKGTLNSGDKIKSLRKTGLQFDCSISVVMQAYEELERNGYIKSVEKSGYYVKHSVEVNLPEPQNCNHSLSPLNSKSDNMTGVIIDMASDSSIVPLGAAIPDTSILSTKKVTNAIKYVLKENPSILNQYTPSKGSSNLRKELTKYMFNRGVNVKSDDIVITNGCAEALFIALKSSTEQGDTVAIETPVFFSLITILEKLQLNVVEIPTKPDTGIDVEIFEGVIKKQLIKAVVFSSSFQNPLGAVMPTKNREKIYGLSVTYNITIIEDDIYGDCSFNSDIQKPVKSLDTFENVIYCSSFSKTLAPGLRVGWAIPGKYLEEFTNIKQITSLGGSLLNQEAIAEYLKTGGYESHLKMFRKKISIQTGRMRKLIEGHFPKDIKVTNPTGGYFLWIELNRNINSYKLHEKAYEKSIGIIPGPVFSATGKYLNCIRISCVTPITDEIIESIRVLGELIKSYK